MRHHVIYQLCCAHEMSELMAIVIQITRSDAATLERACCHVGVEFEPNLTNPFDYSSIDKRTNIACCGERLWSMYDSIFILTYLGG